MTEKNYKAILERLIGVHQENMSMKTLEFVSSIYQWYIIDEKPLTDNQKSVILKINRDILEGRR